MKTTKVCTAALIILGSIGLLSNGCKKDDAKPTVTDTKPYVTVINITTAGGLYSALTKTQRDTISRLTIMGTIDARDFATMRDSMPKLSVLDITGTSIAAYTGQHGTAPILINSAGLVDTNGTVYKANVIPQFAFCCMFESPHDTLLNSITIPTSVTEIKPYAFAKTRLITFTIPSSVTSIDTLAFSLSINLASITIPASVTTIEIAAFQVCMNLSITVDANNTNFSSISGMLYNKAQTTLISCPYYKGSFTIPTSVTTIGKQAFYECISLTSITIPSTVTTIEGYPFYGCSGLTSIYINMTTPPLMTNEDFYLVNTSTCILYVPKGSKATYQAAAGWNAFANIVEQ